MSQPVLVLAAWERAPQALRFDAALGRLAGRCDLQTGPGETRLQALAREAADWAAALDSEALPPGRKAVFFSCSKGGMEAFDGAPGPDLGAWLWRYLSSSPGSQVRDRLGWLGGGVNTPLACATGAYSMGLAFEAVVEGRLDLALAGAAEASLTPLMAASFAQLGALSRAEDPGSYRGPFDQQRDGFVLAEGAGALLLASPAGAQALGRSPLARMLGWACNSDAHHLTSPLPQGRQAAACLRRALERAGVQPAQLGYLNAHGSGTPAGDEAEADALSEVFGPGRLPRVSGLKGALGHALGAAGAIEAVATVRALAVGRVPAHAACRQPLPRLAAKLALDEEPLPGGFAASLSMGFGGHNVALVFGKA